MLISQKWYRIFAALLPFLFVLQSCQSQPRLNANDENTVSEASITPAFQQNSNASSELQELPLPLPTLLRAHRAGANQAIPHPLSPRNVASFSYGLLTTFSGDRVRFQAQGAQWQAELPVGLSRYSPHRLLPVVSSPGTDVGSMLTWLQGQPSSISRARVHLIPAVSNPSGRASVYVGRLGLQGGMDRNDRAHETTLSGPRVVLEAQRPSQLPEGAFGAAAWKEYFGVKVDSEPPLPRDIEDILNNPAPFRLEDEDQPRRVRANHLLTLIPARVNGQPFTLDKLGALILANPGKHMDAFQGNTNTELGDNSHGYRFYSSHLSTDNRTKPLSQKAYWLLLPKTVLAGSRSKTFSEQQEIVSAYHRASYGLPHVLEVATSLLSHYVSHNGARLYANENSMGWWTYTRCKDTDKNGDPLVVGGFGPAGLCVDDYYGYDDYDNVGVVCCRKF